MNYGVHSYGGYNYVGDCYGGYNYDVREYGGYWPHKQLVGNLCTSLRNTIDLLQNIVKESSAHSMMVVAALASAALAMTVCYVAMVTVPMTSSHDFLTNLMDIL